MEVPLNADPASEPPAILYSRLRGATSVGAALILGLAIAGVLPISVTVRPQLWSVLCLAALAALLDTQAASTACGADRCWRRTLCGLGEPAWRMDHRCRSSGRILRGSPRAEPRCGPALACNDCRADWRDAPQFLWHRSLAFSCVHGPGVATRHGSRWVSTRR